MIFNHDCVRIIWSNMIKSVANKMQSDDKKITPAMGDELDVLEAVSKIKKKILTEEQNKLLTNSGRLNNLGNSPDEEKLKLSLRIVNMILLKMEGYHERLYSDQEWNSFDSGQKSEARQVLFQELIAATPEEYGYNLYKKLGGRL